MEKEIGLRRRLAFTALELRPLDMRTALALHPMTISHVLNGKRRLTDAEFATFKRLAVRRLENLFAGKPRRDDIGI